MSSSATWLATRMVARRDIVATVVLSAMVSIVAGLATAMVSASREVDGAFSRLASEVDSPDLFVAAGCDVCDPHTDVPGSLREDRAVAAVDVIVMQSVDLLTAGGVRLGPEPDDACSTGTGELAIASSRWVHHGAPPARLVAGRFPAVNSQDEVVVPVSTARRAGVQVGDQLTLALACDGGDESRRIDARLTVVGLAVGPADFHPPGTQTYFETVFADPALTSRYQLTSSTALAVWLRDGSTAADLTIEPPPKILVDHDARANQVEDSLRPDATTLRVLALATVTVGLLVIGQLIVRRIRQAVLVAAPLSSIGASRSDVARVGVGVGGLVAVGAAIGTVAVAITTRPLLPRGAAADVLRGARSGHGVAAALLGAAIAAVVVTTIGAIAAWRAARRVRFVTETPRLSVASRFSERLSLRPSSSLGLRAAFEPSQAASATAAPVRSGLASMVVAVAAVAGALTFGAGLRQLRHDTRLVGWTWDVAVFTFDADGIAAALADRSDIALMSTGTFFLPEPLTFHATQFEETFMFTFDTGPHAVRPAVLEGRAPAGPTELLLAPGAARKLGASVGDAVPVFLLDESGARTNVGELTLVGLGVLPVVDGQLDKGSAMTLDGLDQLMRRTGATAEPHAVYVDLASGVDVRAFVAQLQAVLADRPDAQVITGSPVIGSEDLVNIDLAHVGWAPVVFAPLMGAGAIVVLVLLVVSGAHARRRDLAIGRALGFATGDVRRVHLWQSLSLIAVALCIGVPAGVIGGGFTWRRYARGLDVVPAVSVPLLQLTVLGLVALIVAAAVSAWPTIRTLRATPVEVLRAE